VRIKLIHLHLLVLLFFSLAAGFLAAFFFLTPSLANQYEQAIVQTAPLGEQVDSVQQQVSDIHGTYEGIHTTTQSSKEQLSTIHHVLAELTAKSKQEGDQLAEQKKAIDAIVAISEQHTKDTNNTLDTILSKVLGNPIGQTFGDKANIKIFSLKEAGYRGYMAKVKLHDPKAVKLVLANDKIADKGETTSAAAKRTGAVLAVNGGGFAKQDGLLHPIGITVVDGEIKTFYRTDLSFIGFNDKGNLVGGAVTTREQIKEMNIMQGATFVPTLLKDGKKLTIPSEWKNRKEPRTLIGHFSNGDLLFIVIDGRQKESSGVTLEEAQNKLLEFNVRDAYTLDGGGSSSFVYNGKVLNSPSDGGERKVISSFVVMP
jgi:exopolysaccharide biosynthesis protein